jgi:hypothetical protein
LIKDIVHPLVNLSHPILDLFEQDWFILIQGLDQTQRGLLTLIPQSREGIMSILIFI